MSAVIWVRRGKHRPASANAGGSMLIQATVPTALGLFFTLALAAITCPLPHFPYRDRRFLPSSRSQHWRWR